MFTALLAAARDRGIVTSDHTAAVLIGVTPATIVNWKKRGVDPLKAVAVEEILAAKN
jgi:DNA-binding transcriptional regulator YdaS (Cro superfamily)